MMVLFVVFIFGAVIIGVGAMLAPALPGEIPRSGLASTLALAFVTGGSLLWMRFIGWDTLVMDYLLFGIVSLVILGGTMVQAHQQATGESDEATPNVHWMSRADFIFLAITGVICLIPVLFLETSLNPVEFEIGQTLTEIKSNFPHIINPASTGFYVLSAYLSQQLQQDIETVYPAVGIVLTFLCVLTAYDCGAEIRGSGSGRILAGIVLIALSVMVLTFADMYPMLMAILFGLAIILLMIRIVRYRQWQDIAGLLMLVGTLIVGL